MNTENLRLKNGIMIAKSRHLRYITVGDCMKENILIGE